MQQRDIYPYGRIGSLKHLAWQCQASTLACLGVKIQDQGTFPTFSEWIRPLDQLNQVLSSLAFYLAWKCHQFPLPMVLSSNAFLGSFHYFCSQNWGRLPGMKGTSRVSTKTSWSPWKPQACGDRKVFSFLCSCRNGTWIGTIEVCCGTYGHALFQEVLGMPMQQGTNCQL